ncbi:hypothetical protein J3A83DRAFT_4184517 [Scleroderma citrinum]
MSTLKRKVAGRHFWLGVVVVSIISTGTGGEQNNTLSAKQIKHVARSNLPIPLVGSFDERPGATALIMSALSSHLTLVTTGMVEISESPLPYLKSGHISSTLVTFPSHIHILHYQWPLNSIFMYDYILTFQEEVDRFWTKPCLSWAFVFFITNRYIMLLGRIPAFLDNFIRTKDGPYSHMQHPVLDRRAIDGNCSDHRCRNRRVLYFFVLVLVIITAIALYSLLVKFPASPQNALIPPQGCLHSISQQQALRFAAAWGGQLVFDAMTFGFTVWKLFGMESFGSRSLADILLRDGTMYFACVALSWIIQRRIMTIMNIANITILLVANPNLKYLFSVPTNV